MSKGVNTHETLNTAMKKTAVFHYTEWKNREEGAGRGELGKYTDWPRTSCVSKQCLNFLESPPSLTLNVCWSALNVYIINSVLFYIYMFFWEIDKNLFYCTFVSWLTHRAEGAHAVAALLPCQVFLIAHGAHTIGSWVAIETAACGTKHGHRALVRLLGHC